MRAAGGGYGPDLPRVSPQLAWLFHLVTQSDAHLRAPIRFTVSVP